MKDLTLQTKLIIAGAALLLILIIGIVIYRSGKSKGEAAGAINLSSPVNDNPGGTGTNASTGPQASGAELKVLAQKIHDDMSGGNLTHDIGLWSQVLALSDGDFVKLYNEFDFDFQKDSGQSLRDWITGETAYYVPFLGTQWGATKDTLLARMNKLSLS